MNLANLIKWSMGIVLSLATVTHIDDIHQRILKIQARLIYESRASSWGSPSFFAKTNYEMERRGKVVECKSVKQGADVPSIDKLFRK